MSHTNHLQIRVMDGNKCLNKDKKTEGVIQEGDEVEVVEVGTIT